MPSQTIPSLAPFINQHIADATLLLPLPQQTNQCMPNAAAHQPTPGSLAPLSSSLQHQSNCLQAINKTIKQYSQHLKAEQLDRQTLQLILLQLQNNLALLRYLPFSPVETISNKNITVKDSATSPLLNSNPNPNPNPIPTSSDFPLSVPRDHTLFCSTPVGAVGPPRTKTNNTTNANPQPTPTRRKLLQLRCRTSHQEFANWKNCLPTNYQLTHPSLRGSIPNISLYDKLRQLAPGHSDVIIWKIPSVKFVFDSAKVARPSSDTLIEPATSFSSPFSGLNPMATTSSSNSTRMVLDPLRVSALRFHSHSSQETMRIFPNGPSQRPSTLEFETNWTQ